MGKPRKVPTPRELALRADLERFGISKKAWPKLIKNDDIAKAERKARDEVKPNES